MLSSKAISEVMQKIVTQCNDRTASVGSEQHELFRSQMNIKPITEWAWPKNDTKNCVQQKRQTNKFKTDQTIENVTNIASAEIVLSDLQHCIKPVNTLLLSYAWIGRYCKRIYWPSRYAVMKQKQNNRVVVLCLILCTKWDGSKNMR